MVRTDSNTSVNSIRGLLMSLSTTRRVGKVPVTSCWWNSEPPQRVSYSILDHRIRYYVVAFSTQFGYVYGPFCRIPWPCTQMAHFIVLFVFVDTHRSHSNDSGFDTRATSTAYLALTLIKWSVVKKPEHVATLQTLARRR